VLDQGRIQQIGTPIELVRSAGQPLCGDLPRHRQPDRGRRSSPAAASSPKGFSLPTSAARPAGLHLDPPAGYSVGPSDSGIAAASPSASSSAASRAITRGPAQAIVVDVPHRRGAGPSRGRRAVGLIEPPSQMSVLR
jgi:hypothetical protein